MAKETGLSIRFIREYTPEDNRRTLGLRDMALTLAMSPRDETDIRTFSERLADAYQFLSERHRHIH